MKPKAPTPESPHWVIRCWRALGPGLIAGAADDDPSGIATYSIAGAQAGTTMLWTAILTWPLMSAVQLMCARIGMVTGRGLIRALEQKFPRPLIVLAGTALLLANTINVGADLAGMADAAAELSGLKSRGFVIVFGLGIALATIGFSYVRIAGALKWLSLSLFAYIATAFLAHPKWAEVLAGAARPHWPNDAASWSVLVALFGTTISPYLFFWQASEEVEEGKAKNRGAGVSAGPAMQRRLRERRLDVGVGTFFSNLVMFFIILSCALTLHQHGITHISSSREAAMALRPIAGKFATALYTTGIIGVGFLAIPTLTGSAAYALAEIFNWKEGLDKKFRQARGFYLVIVVATLGGIGIDFAGFNPVKALYWSAVLNGLLAPFLLTGLLLTASDGKIMRQQPSSGLSRIVVGAAAAVMFAAGVGMFVF